MLGRHRARRADRLIGSWARQAGANAAAAKAVLDANERARLEKLRADIEHAIPFALAQLKADGQRGRLQIRVRGRGFRRTRQRDHAAWQIAAASHLLEDRHLDWTYFLLSDGRLVSSPYGRPELISVANIRDDDLEIVRSGLRGLAEPAQPDHDRRR